MTKLPLAIIGRAKTASGDARHVVPALIAAAGARAFEAISAKSFLPVARIQ